MGSSILRGITTALLVTVLTLIAGIVWSVLNFGGLSISLLLDIGLLASCIVGGYRTAKESGEWLLGGIVGAGYVTVGTLLLALFLPIRGWGFIQVLVEGAIIGLVAGAIGAGGTNSTGINAWSGKRSQFTPSYADYETNDISNKFDWDKEEPEEWKEVPITNWIESSKSNFKGTRGAKNDWENNEDVQWSWDREKDKDKDKDKDKSIDSESGYEESLVVWEPDPVQTEVSKRNKSSLDKLSVNRGSRPWWE